ncbi:kinase-like protein [Macrolepiota fuliginosa MF-IS2]|uniref:cAMP-dependent protein kinase n=1 Tax=Macrolepiota fuliginosa MF-IS2 TaxID=1400762 RepID=A0A9P6CAU5_9AGAR|nr:kinase-like protein [Macrolepiota fuliginosa MF-IS2]
MPVADSDESTKLTVVFESSSLADLSITPLASPTDILSLFSCAISPASPATPTTPCLSPPTPSTPLTPEGPTLVNDDCDDNMNGKLTPTGIIIISSTPKRQPLTPLPIIPNNKNKNKTQHSSPILKIPSKRKILPSSYTEKENQYPPQISKDTEDNKKNKKKSSKGTYYRKDTFMAALRMDMIPIGEGGFGQVFRATAVGSQTLAVKLMQRGTLAQEIAIVNEVNALRAAKGCRWAVEMVYFQAVEEQALIALTYIPEGDMHSYWERAGFCLDFDTARFYTAQLVLAIHDLHTRGIIHRDIKLENMMLDSRRNLKLVDFGLAQVFDHTTVSERDYPLFYQMKKLGGDVFPLLWATSHNPHQTDLANGTEGYAPPEVWKSQMHSFGIDYFAMGCVLHLLITGNAPFEFDPVAQDYDYNDIHVEKSMGIDAYDFLRRVLANRPGTRPNVRRMKIHPVFRGIDWDALAAGKVEAPPYPYGH